MTICPYCRKELVLYGQWYRHKIYLPQECATVQFPEKLIFAIAVMALTRNGNCMLCSGPLDDDEFVCRNCQEL